VSETAALLRARAQSASRPGAREDSARIALCIEGGAMRGVVAAGMVAALEELGLTRAFDAVYGSSAGAICGAYFLASQAGLGARIYSEDINNRRFASRARGLRGRAIVNLDYLVHEVMVARKPLDVDAVLASGTPLSVVATDVMSGDAAVLRGFSSGNELLAALRASATMPVIAGGPCAFRGRQYFDGSLAEPIPLQCADDEGCTHMVVLLTRPFGVPRNVSWFDRWVIAPSLNRLSVPLAQRYLIRSAPYAAVQQLIASGRSRSGRAEIVGIRPSMTVRKLERNRALLLAGAASGRNAVIASLG
jgi:predicted patatin/cPLA2 family phospholipase